MLGVLSGLSPRPAGAPVRPSPGGGFRRPEVLGSLDGVAVGPDGRLWAVGAGGLLEVERARFHRWDEPLRLVAAGSFVAAGGPGGLVVLEADRLVPVLPAEPILGLVATGSGSLVASARSGSRLVLREAGSGLAPWHARAWLPPGSGVLAVDGDAVLVGTDSGLFRVPRGTGRVEPIAALGPSAAVVGLAHGAGRTLVRLADGSCFAIAPGAGAAERLEGGGEPGLFRDALAVGGVGRIELVPPVPQGLPPLPQELPEGLRHETLVPIGADGRGIPLARTSRALLQASRRAWRPAVTAGMVPTRARELKRTRSGALWAIDPEGGLRHRSPEGTWTSVALPPGLAAEGKVGIDGEALLLACRAGARETQPGTNLFWVPAPRGDEVGGFAVRVPEPVPLGVFGDATPRAMAALGSTLFAAVGSRILAVRGRQVETWGREQGLPDAPVLDLAALFDDLWALFEGHPPMRFPGGRGRPEAPVEDGPAGQGTVLAPDEESGQVWVGLTDGARGGVASLSRDGIWITQLRLPGAAVAVSAAQGAVSAATTAGLVLLEDGERIRRIFGVEDGLPSLECRAVGLTGRELWVDAGELRSWTREEAPAPGAGGGLRV